MEDSNGNMLFLKEVEIATKEFVNFIHSLNIYNEILKKGHDKEWAFELTCRYIYEMLTSIDKNICLEEGDE